MSWIDEAWKVVKNMPRPVDYNDIADRTGMSVEEAQKCLCRLRKAECIELAHGSARTGRYYQAKPGAVLPPDLRGKHPHSQKALEHARELRRRASWPISQITAARLK